LDNPGRLAKKGGAWTVFGRKLPDEEVLVAKHKNETEPSGWARYPKAQMDVALEVAKLLVKTYGLKDVIGHEDISPGRKQDPGPAFPMESFRGAAMGGGPGPAAPPAAPSAPQAGTASLAGTCFRVTTRLNVRSAPSTDAEKVAGSPLPEGTLILCFEDSGDWKRITTRDLVNGATVSGWASARFMEAAPGEAPPAAPAAVFRATTALNVRGGPGKEHAAVTSPLAAGTRVREVEDGGEWKRVTVLGPADAPTGVTGWVSAKFLERV
ncbi:MAG TPA: SH3 domain-containing protein, partial [Longimicrobium sp.]|nr:SH3 domain-containing protein [Longimicrobium sp.]